MLLQLQFSAKSPPETVSWYVQHIWLEEHITNLSLEGHAAGIKEGNLS